MTHAVLFAHRTKIYSEREKELLSEAGTLAQHLKDELWKICQYGENVRKPWDHGKELFVGKGED
jgi:hypothetical protein